jgi:hypothetical protein
MKNFGQLLCGLVVLGLGLNLGEARAQTQDFLALQQPTISPYLNLFRSGSNPALNYLDLVRPQFQAQGSFQTLQQQQNLLQTQIRQFTPTPSGQGTAKVPGYMTHGKYFGNGGVIAAGTGQTHRSLSDRRTMTGTVPNQTTTTRSTVPTFGGATAGTAGTGTQTRTVFGSNPLNNQFNSPGLSPTYLSPTTSSGFTPFNPYRGF